MGEVPPFKSRPARWWHRLIEWFGEKIDYG